MYSFIGRRSKRYPLEMKHRHEEILLGKLMAVEEPVTRKGRSSQDIEGSGYQARFLTTSEKERGALANGGFDASQN